MKYMWVNKLYLKKHLFYICYMFDAFCAEIMCIRYA